MPDPGEWDAVWLDARLATFSPAAAGTPYGAILDGALATVG